MEHRPRLGCIPASSSICLVRFLNWYQLENHQSQIQSQLEKLYQHLFSLQQQSETTTPQMKLILEELQESLPISQQILKDLKAAIAFLQTTNTKLNQELSEIKTQSRQAIKQSAIQSQQQQKQVKQLTESVNQLCQPIPIKPGWVKICGFLTMYAISTACTVVLMLRYLPPQISQPLPPPQSNPHK